MDAALLMLVDGRFPAGGHAYSAGVETAVAIGDVVDAATLERYLEGRLATTGQVDAAFSAAVCTAAARTPEGELRELVAVFDAEYSARMPSAYLRATSRRLGRQLLRASCRIWQSPALDILAGSAAGAHQPIALGAVVATAGGDASDAIALSCHHLIAAVTSAAVRLLGLDPIEMAVVQERIGHRADEYRFHAPAWSSMKPAELPAWGGSLTEILGEHHGALDARMFVA